MLSDFFKLNEKNTDIKTEIVAGLTTFLVMSYILGVNPTILSAAGMPVSGVFIATAISSGIACIVMGLLSNYPIGLSAGMSLPLANGNSYGATPKLNISLQWVHSDIPYLNATTNIQNKLTENYISSNEKIKKALGVDKMPVDARKGLKRTLDSFRA